MRGSELVIRDCPRRRDGLFKTSPRLLKATNNPRPGLYDTKNRRKIRYSETEKVTIDTRLRDMAKNITRFREPTLFCRDFRFLKDHSLPLI